MSGNGRRGPIAALGGDAIMILVALVVGGVAWIVGWLAAHGTCAVSDCTVRAGAVTAVLRMLIGRSPEEAWQAPGMSAVVFWVLAVLLTALALSALAAVVVLASRTGDRLRPAGGHGLGGWRDMRRYYSAAALERMTWLRPDLGSPKACDLGVPVGRALLGKVWIACEDSGAVSAPSRQGKTRFLIIPMILAWRGPAVVTSVRTELVTATLRRRSGRGPVAVFAPTTNVDRVVSGHHVLRWSLTSGCENPTVALRRARALAANAAQGAENADFWQANAQTALAAMLHAAALTDAGIDELSRWCAAPGQARAAATILKTCGGSAAEWGAQLEGQLSGDERTVSNVWATLNSCVSLPLMDPAVRQALSPTKNDELDVEAFLASCGTLYVVGDASAASAPIVAALVEEVYAVATERANRSPNNRLVPPLAQILDEINNIANLPSLPTMMSAGGGSNVMTVVVEQSRAQSGARWGSMVAAAIWDSATVKILLGGIMREETLREVSGALGERVVGRVTTSRGRGPTSTSWAEHKEAVLTGGQVHALERGHSLVIKAGAKAMIMRSLPGEDDEETHGRVETWLMRRAGRRLARTRRREQGGR